MFFFFNLNFNPHTSYLFVLITNTIQSPTITPKPSMAFVNLTNPKFFLLQFLTRFHQSCSILRFKLYTHFYDLRRRPHYLSPETHEFWGLDQQQVKASYGVCYSDTIHWKLKIAVQHKRNFRLRWWLLKMKITYTLISILPPFFSQKINSSPFLFRWFHRSLQPFY